MKSDYEKIRRYVLESKKQDEIEREEEARKKRIALGYPAEPQKEKEEKHYDSPNTMSEGTATVLYIIAMAISLIFKEWYLIWGCATFAYFCFMTRHNRKKKK